jgi:hypothetical protein
MAHPSGTSIVYALLVAVLALGWSQLFRTGYSPDEEYTVIAVRGIEDSAEHLPLLPSGLLYDRGLAFSYASWAAAQFSGTELPVYRALALLCAVVSVWSVWLVVSSAAPGMAGTLAVFLVVVSVPFWAAATTGRFYAPLLAVFTSALFPFCRLARSNISTLGRSAAVTTFGGLAFLAFLGRLVHELAFTVVAIPLFCFAVDNRRSRAKWLTAALALATGLVTAQILILCLHALAPPSGGQTMVQRFFIWQVINLFEVPRGGQFGIPMVALLLGWLIAPRRARLILAVTLGIAAMIASVALARALTTAPLSPALVERVLTDGSRYPLDMFWHIARATPLTLGLALGLMIARLAGVGGEWPSLERAAHLLWIGWVLWFGVIESGITLNYLLLPVSLMLVAIAVDVAAIVSHTIARMPAAGRVASWSMCALVVAAVAADQWRGDGPLRARLEAARPTIDISGIEQIRSSLQPGDRVACTDELACLMLVGRIDAWLALDDYVRERFVIRKGDGRLVGVYTGKPAVFRPAQMFDWPLANRTLIVDVFKELPIGNTREWLPRALRADGLVTKVLLETAQARVVEVAFNR